MKQANVSQGQTTRLRSSRHSLPARAPPPGSGNFSVVGIGASAGGLDACRKLVDALPANIGIAFILIQHLDPTHESMMVDLLAGHTSMTVHQAADGMKLACDQLYVIPPGTYLAVGDGVLRLSQPQARHGARLPFDFLLHSLAEAYGPRAICVILSGSGADGSLGLKAVHEKGGLVIAQDPNEAAYDGMPSNAIMTGVVDLVLPVAKIPEALIKYDRQMGFAGVPDKALPPDRARDWLPEFIDLLRTKTAHDFTLYKPGTLHRRIERRMAMVGIEPDGMERYLDLVRRDASERDLLATDLLINVTSFFRDPKVFELLATKIIPTIILDQSDHPIRVWVAGCSTGEEAYSLAILFRENLTEAKSNIKVQVFASDVDPDAVASAREGLYPPTIEADVSPTRLARFFSKEDHGYRVLPELRSMVIFTVQDVLTDPPFARLDMISCRNMLIYLGPEAQTNVIALFHFALRKGGILLLGGSETIGNADGRFDVISKPERLYRHIGLSRPGEFGFSRGFGDGVRVPARAGSGHAPSRHAALADLCRRLVMETYAPAAVLINRKHECLYSLGPTDRYLRVAPGHPTHDVLAMARQDLRIKLRSAIQQASQQNTRVIVGGGRATYSGSAISFGIDVRPVVSQNEELLLICFVDEPASGQAHGHPVTPLELPRVAALEHELEITRTELQGAIHNLEISGEEQKAINEEALSVNEEYQSANEELLTSKEELQSLNEELTALNSQLQETLERQRTTSDDLQNVLYSTDVATIFLDTRLHIRFFTPATRSLFSVIPSDIGRPLADLNSLAADSTLMTDAKAVMHSLTPIEREIEAQSGAWYVRRVLPYRTRDDRAEGVVITFADITERRRVADELGAAKRQAELANVAKSRFLAAASHDLRQPLQTLALLQGLLAKTVEGDRAQKLVARIDETLSAISGMLNTLLDINQIEAGTVHADMASFPVDALFDRLRDEFTYPAQSKRLALRVISCGLSIHSDQRLLEQIIRNLLSNAIKYTKRGKVLLGCRRHKEMLSIEVWDTGIGIPEEELHAIFEEYHQLDNPARERSRGLGLGLSIVQRLGRLLGHRVRVRSWPGKGSVFAIEVLLTPCAEASERKPDRDHAIGDAIADVRRDDFILIVEDDPEVRELLEVLLKKVGYRAAVASDGIEALGLVARGIVLPDLILADYNLPNGMDGLEVTTKLREKLGREVPAIILTGDISTGIVGRVALLQCIQLNKPIKLKELMQAIEHLLPAAPSVVRQPLPRPRAAETVDSPGPAVIFVVDDDDRVRNTIREVLEDDGRHVEDYAACELFLEAFRPGRESCLLIDAYLPGMSGLELLRRLREAGHDLPAIMITGNSDVPMAVQAMKAGASDFIEKPITRQELLDSVGRALEQSRDSSKLSARQEDAAQHVAGLTSRQRQIMELVLAGHPSKNIAADLRISQRTVENHRASIMRKTGTKSLPALARLALVAVGNDADAPRVRAGTPDAAGRQPPSR